MEGKISVSVTLPAIDTVYRGPLEKAMAAHSSALAWRIPGTGAPGGLHRVGHDFSDLAAA